MVQALSVTDHRRDAAGLTYVYPVVSRRAGGISVGINLNPNNACNWRCIYCQVPGLQRGAAPPLDHARLATELAAMLRDLLTGEFYQNFQVPPESCRLRDIAISGNGEPTTLKDFDAAIATIARVLDSLTLPPNLKRVVISNGSQLRRPEVRRGLAHWGDLGGELWFKLDRATAPDVRQLNQTTLSPQRVLKQLETAAALCPVWLQSCWFALDGKPPQAAAQQAYLDFLGNLKARGLPLRGILLYGPARPSHQPEAPRLSPLPADWMETFAERIRALGWKVQVTP